MSMPSGRTRWHAQTRGEDNAAEQFGCALRRNEREESENEGKRRIITGPKRRRARFRCRLEQGRAPLALVLGELGNRKAILLGQPRSARPGRSGPMMIRKKRRHALEPACRTQRHLD